MAGMDMCQSTSHQTIFTQHHIISQVGFINEFACIPLVGIYHCLFQCLMCMGSISFRLQRGKNLYFLKLCLGYGWASLSVKPMSSELNFATNGFFSKISEKIFCILVCLFWKFFRVFNLLTGTGYFGSCIYRHGKHFIVKTFERDLW